MKRFIWLAVILAVLGLIVFGGWSLVNKNRGDNLLKRAEVARRAGNTDEARDLAMKFIASDPGNDRGYEELARVSLATSDFAQARQDIQRGLEQVPASVSLRILRADSYTSEGHKKFNEDTTKSNSEALKSVVELLDGPGGSGSGPVTGSNPLLAELLASSSLTLSEQDRVYVYFLQAQNYVTLHGVRYCQFVLATKERRNRTENPSAPADPNLPSVEEAQVLMSKARDRAITAMIPAVQAQPQQERVGTWLVQYVGDRWLETSRLLRDGADEAAARELRELLETDEKLLDELQTMLLSMRSDQQPAGTICKLVTVRLGQAAQKEDELKLIQARQWAMTVIEPLMINRPKDLESKSLAVDLALASNNAQRAKTLCDEALKLDPGNQQFRIKRIQALLELGETSETQRELQTPFSNQTWSTQLRIADMSQALADQIIRKAKGRQFTEAEARDWKQLNNAAGDGYREAVKAVDRQNPNLMLPEQQEALEYAKFRAYNGMVRAILSQLTVLPKQKSGVNGKPYEVTVDERRQWADTAFPDAQKCLQQLPRNPDALRLFVDVALMANHRNAAHDAVKKASEGDEPVTVAAAARLLKEVFLDEEGYKNALIRLGTLTPGSRQDRVLIAESLLYLGRTQEATPYWRGITPDMLRPSLQKVLGRALIVGGQYLSASEYLLAACRSDPRDLESRHALAEAYWGAQLVDSASEEVQKVLAQDAEHEGALLLLARIRMVRGEDPTEQLTVLREGGLSGLPLAMNQLQLGNARESVKTCDEIVASQATDADKYLARMVKARALLALGQRSEATKLWTELIKEQPTRRETLRALASFRQSEGMPIQNIAAELSSCGAHPLVVHLLAAELYLQSQSPAEAVERTQAVLSERTATDEQQTLARELLARAYSMQGKTDEALAALATLENDSRRTKPARMMKCALLLQSGRLSKATDELDRLRRELESEGDYDMLMQVANLYRLAKQFNKALEVCDRAIAMNPTKPGAYVQKANLYLQERQIALARSVLDQALVAQKDNPAVYIDLAGLQERQGDPLGAAATLEKMESISESSKLQSLLIRAELFAKYHMPDRAVACLEKVLTLHVSQEPQFRLRLGRIYAAIDMSEKARKYFHEVAPDSSLYVPARLMAVELLTDLEDRQRALDVLAAERTQDIRVMQARMATALMMRQDREAIAIYSEYRKDLRPGQKPAVATLMALEAFCRLNDLDRTLEFCRDVNPDDTDPVFNVLMPLLASRDKPALAAEKLPRENDADITPAQILLGLLSDVGKEAQWYARLQKLDARQRVAPGFMALAARVAGDEATAKKQLPALEGQRGWIALGARQFLNQPDSPQTRQQARELLRMMEAQRVNLTAQTWRWGMDLLKQDPTCLWAAQILFSLRCDETMREEFSKLLGDTKTPEGTLMMAQLTAWQKQFRLASFMYARAAQGLGNPTEIVLMQAKASEAYGDVPGALELYQQALARPGAFDLESANSAAYLVTQLPTPTTKQLEQARLWSEKVVEAAPQIAAARDTLGWICYLLGDYEKARAEMTLAILGLTDQPEAHYHMAKVEQALGNTAAAKLHLNVTVALLESRSRLGTPVLTNLLEKAQEELAKLE